MVPNVMCYWDDQQWPGAKCWCYTGNVGGVAPIGSRWAFSLYSWKRRPAVLRWFWIGMPTEVLFSSLLRIRRVPAVEQKEYWYVIKVVGSFRCFRSMINEGTAMDFFLGGGGAKIRVNISNRVYHLSRSEVLLWFYRALYILKQIGMFISRKFSFPPCP